MMPQRLEPCSIFHTAPTIPVRSTVERGCKTNSTESARTSPTDESFDELLTTIVGNHDGDIAVGLSDPSTTHNRKEMLELVNRLRDTGVQTDIDLPMIAVIGNQSAGKSSLIESISGITLPRSTGTCTRCPTECKLSHSDSSWSCIVKLHFHTNSRGLSIPVRRVPFGLPITSKFHVEDRIRRAQRAILNPSKDPSKYLHGEESPEGNELSFSKNYVSLEISGNDLADLSFVDLPGLIASVGTGGNERDIELVKSLVTSYIEKPSCVILLTVACETDFENQGAHHLAKSFDPQGKRTVGVLTKPDRIPAGEEFRWLKIIRNETEPLVNNWYCVRQPSSQLLSKGITWSEARRQEDGYFSVTQPWCSLGSQYQSYLRTSNLTDRLSIILSELIAKRLPEILNELVNTIRQTEAARRKLPRAPSNDPVSEVIQALNDFSRELSRRVQGTPDEDGLLQTIRPHQQTFRRAIHNTAPDFMPWETDKTSKCLPKANFLQDEEGEEDVVMDDEEESDEADEGNDVPDWGDVAEEHQVHSAKKTSRVNRKIYIDEVLQRAQRARTRELPDSYPFVVQKAYIKEFTKRWRPPAMDLFDHVYAILRTDVGRLIEQHFEHMGKGTAKQSVLMIVYDHLDRAANRTKSKIEWLLSLEQVPTTLNTHYFSSYKDKFLAYYRASRTDGDLFRKLKRIESHSQVEGTPRGWSSHQDSYATVNKILSGLNEVGISAKATELVKLLPPDPMEPALHIMASVRAYFQVAYKRFADLIPMAIDHEIVLGFQNGIDEALRDGLQITGPDGYSRCKSMVEELSSIASTRQDLHKKMERLQAARQELRKLM